MNEEKELCEWHDKRLGVVELSQERLLSDVERVAQRLVNIETVLWGQEPDRDGGIRNHMRTIEGRIKEIAIWVKALIIVAAIWIFLFGPQRFKEIVAFFK